jgi:dipeptidyl-peptidase-4
MKRIYQLYLLFIAVVFSGSISAQTMLERYEKAEQFLPKNISKLAKNVSLRIHPVEETSNFWYKLQTEKGERYYFFDGENIKSKEAFDHIQLADAILEETGKEIAPDSLKLNGLKFKLKENRIQFKIAKTLYEMRLEDYSVEKVNTDGNKKKNQAVSPDGNWMAEVKEYNLFLTDLNTKEEFQLTDDGIEKYEYATLLSSYKLVDESVGEEYDPSIYLNWSTD